MIIFSTESELKFFSCLRCGLDFEQLMVANQDNFVVCVCGSCMLSVKKDKENVAAVEETEKDVVVDQEDNVEEEENDEGDEE